MTKEDKELLLEDICSRLPYGVKCQIQEDEDTYVGTLHIIEVDNIHGHLLEFVETISGLNCQVYLSEIKPCLFPLSSMTEEQRKEYESLCIKETSECTDLYGIIFSKDYFYDTIESINYLYKNHIDIRGLIEKGLAVDCTNLNIY